MPILLICFLIIVTGTAIAYRFSAVISARKRASLAIAGIEALRSELRSVQDETHQSTVQAAHHLKSSIQDERLRSIPIDEIKKYSSGLRLQALKDAGMWSILDLRGISSQRLANIRGVGPKSAGSIAAVAEVLTRTSNERPIPRPSLPFSGDLEHTLLQSIYGELFFEKTLLQSKTAVESLHIKVQEELNTVNADSTFVTWCFGLGHSEKVRQAKEVAEQIVQILEADREVLQQRDYVSNALAECRSLCRGRVNPETLLKEYRANPSLYDWCLADALGITNSSPRPTALIEEQAEVMKDTHADQAEVAIDHPSSLLATEETQPTGKTPVEPAKTVAEALERLRQLQQHRENTKNAVTTDALKNETTAVQNIPILDELTTLQVGHGIDSTPKEFPLPTANISPNRQALRWVSPGESVVIQGVSISAAYFYCGSNLRSSDRFVIDPSLPAKIGAVWDTNYRTSYTEFTPEQRYRYLQWLSDGCTEISAFASLYFQGLERRLLESLRVPESVGEAEVEAVLQEVRRIESIVRGTPTSVSYHANSLLSFFDAKSYANAPAPKLATNFSRGYELPLDLCLGLGCFIRDKQAIPAEWALRWSYLEPTIYPRTAVSRCPDEFEAAFRYLYAQKHGEGLVIRPNKTLLELNYKPTWTGGDDSPLHLEFTDTPDVKALTAPQHTLKELVEEATTLVDPYSRLLGPAATRAGTLEALMVLPSFLWMEEARSRFDQFRKSMLHTATVATTESIFTALGATGEITPSRVMDLARNLQNFEIGFEPDVLSGARRPKANDPVVLFSLIAAPEEDRKSIAYLSAALLVAAAAALNLADGHASEIEENALNKVLSRWEGISPDHRTRLEAHYWLCLHKPPTPASLKARFESLDTEDRKRMASSLSLLATSDGVVSPEEVRLLERFYKMLSFEAQELYSDLHGAAGTASRISTPPSSITSKNKRTFLDVDRISNLRQESNEVSQLLSEVFVEEPPTPPSLPELPPATAPKTTPIPAEKPIFPAMTDTDQRFLALLLTRAQWSREELLKQTTDMQIMLDGALERMNELALDHFGDVLTEGEDPIFIQHTLLETAE